MNKRCRTDEQRNEDEAKNARLKVPASEKMTGCYYLSGVDSILVVCMAKGREDDFTIYPQKCPHWPPSIQEIRDEVKARRPWATKFDIFARKNWTVATGVKVK